MAVPNATAKRDFTATCGHTIRKGERLFMFRERALSMREASAAGTLYPWRRVCAACAARRA